MSARRSLPDLENCLKKLAELKSSVRPLSSSAEFFLSMAIEDLRALQTTLDSYLAKGDGKPPII